MVCVCVCLCMLDLLFQEIWEMKGGGREEATAALKGLGWVVFAGGLCLRRQEMAQQAAT